MSTIIHQISGEIALDGRVSWVPGHASGSQLVNCYLLSNEHGSFLVDTGLRAHERTVIAALREYHDKSKPLVILLTRTEMECCLNIPAIESEFRVDTVWYTGGITVPRSAAVAKRISVPIGENLRIEPIPGLFVELISPLVRLLPTLWLWEPENGALFTSDSFAYEPGADVVERGLHKFSWFKLADTRNIVRFVRDLPNNRDIQAIYSSFGEAILGEQVSIEIERFADAIEEVGLR